METPKTQKKEREGIVVSNKMRKTIVVRVDRTFPHPRYKKIITRGKKYYVHSENELEIGQKVRIQETRPLSKLKRWRVIEKLGK